MHVGQAAGIAVECAKEHICVVVRRGKRPPGACTGYLIGLLIILLGGKIIVDLRRKGIVGNPFQPVGPADIPTDTQHGFQRKHHFHGRTQFAAAVGGTPMEHLVPSPEAIGDAHGLANDSGCPGRGLPVSGILGKLPPDQRRLESLRQVHAVYAPLLREQGTIPKQRTGNHPKTETSSPWSGHGSAQPVQAKKALP